MTRLISCAAALALLAGVSVAQSQVRTVAGDGGEDFLDIQSAVDASAAGDVVLVRPAGTRYEGFTLDGKGLTVLGDGPVRLGDAQVTIRNVPAGELAVLRGFDFDLFAGVAPCITALVALEQNAGTVWIEDVTTSGLFVGSSCEIDVCSVVDSNNVVFLRCDLEGGTFLACGLSALRLERSTAAVFETSLRGAPGCAAGVDGPAGIHLEDSTLFLFDSTVDGGQGGPGLGQPFGACLVEPGPGGPGVDFVGAATLEVLEATVLGGPGGARDNSGSCSSGPSGVPYEGGSPIELIRLARSLEVDSPVRAGDTSRFCVAAEQGDFVFALWSLSTDVVTTTIFSGRFLVGLASNIIALGPIPASGTLDFPVNWGPLPPALQAFDITAQVGVISAAGVPLLGSGSLLHVLNQAF